MKPPWKYFAQLVSRQRSSEAAGETRTTENARKPVEIELRPVATILLASPEATPATEQVDENTTEDVVTAPAAIDSEIDVETPDLPPEFAEAAKAEVTKEPKQSSSDPLEQRPAGEAAVQLPKPQQAKLKIAKKNRAGSTVEIPVTTSDATVPATSSPADPFFNHATSLDEDIKQLKDLLARKLRMQNAQLREMLERFERS